MAEQGASQIQSGSKPGDLSFLQPGSKLAAEMQTEDEEAIVKMVAGLWMKAKEYRRPYDRHDARFWDLWEGNHWQSRISHTLTRAVVNQAHSAVETFVGHALDGMVDPQVKARKPELREKAKLIEKWLTYEWDANDVAQQGEHVVRSAAVTGRGWWNVEWDQSRLGGRGDVAILPVDERYVWASPHARTYEELRYLIDARNVPRDWLEANFERAAEVPPGVWDGTLSATRAYAATDDRDIGAWQEFKTTDGKYTNVSLEKGGRGKGQADLATFVRAYIRQDDGSMRLVIVANGVLLQDGPSPYDDEDFPYACLSLIPGTDSLYGKPLIQFIEGLQEILNNSMSYLLDQQRYSSDPMLVVDEENVEQGQLIDNSPGAVLSNSSQRGQGYYWLQAPGFNQGWLEVQRVITEYMDSVLGRVDILRGERPAGVDTLGGLEVVRDQANVRLRKFTEHVRAAVKRVYKLTLSRLRQFAKDERTIRYVTRGGQEDFAQVNPAAGTGPDGMPVQEQTIESENEFDVAFGKDVPGGRQARIELAMTLAGTPAEDGLPMVDRQFVLEECEVEEAPEVMRRMAAMAQSQAEAQAAAAGKAEGAPGGEAQPSDVGQIMELFMGRPA